ncbi:MULTISPECIES: hypothetical protein [Deefgea]|uniref:Tetratricopeptide repeat protein n=1 Tax=Deefgea chitinilytica TaxID=570276 RepID=A0ABS2CAG9_9NEIS|nr:MULTISPECIES: hypothetical protein [Deefgea]MBM5571047.1 hypothetical protein [Deefgea chitinilytica]MBM9888277.1 hypothetical protein [Deefgea sp. CFH1-16]
MTQNILSIDLQLLELKSQQGRSSAEMRIHVESILSHAEQINYQHGIAEAKLFLAQLLWADMSFIDASSIIKDAIQFAKADGAKNLLAEAYHLSALIYVAKGRYTLALAQWLKCLKLMQTVQHPTLAIDIRIGLGNLWAIDQQNNKALEELSQAFAQAQAIQSPSHAAKAAICLSRERLRLGHFEEALASLEQGERHLKSLNNPTWFAEICNYRARTWLALGQADRAHTECQIALQTIAAEPHLVWAQCLTLITLAQVDLARQHDPLPNLNRANQLADRYQLHSFQSQIALIRSQYAEQQAQWEEALASFKRYRQLDLGEIAQHQQQGARDFSSVEFLRLVQQIDLSRQTVHPPTSDSGKAIRLPHNYLPRYLWLQQLTQQLIESAHFGLVFIRLPSDNARFPLQRILYLMATICVENGRFCQYAKGIFAIYLANVAEDEFNRSQRNIGDILQLLPLETGTTAIAATLRQADDQLAQILSRIAALLYPEGQ